MLQQKRLAKPRFAAQGNPVVRSLYQLEAEPFVPSVEELDIPLKERRSIATLTECSCRWPIGDPQLAGLPFLQPRQGTGTSLLRIPRPPRLPAASAAT